MVIGSSQKGNDCLKAPQISEVEPNISVQDFTL